MALLVAVVAVAGAPGSALADSYNSPATVTTTGPNTLNWTGQGTTGGQLGTLERNADSTPYLLWIFTTGDTNLAAAPVLHLGGSGSGNFTGTLPGQGSGGAYHFTTGFFPLSTLTAYVTFNVTDFGNGRDAQQMVLTISHGWPASPPEKKSVTVTTTVFDAATHAAWADTEKAGAGAYDTSRVVPPSALPVPTGTVTYIFYNAANCISPNALGADHIVVTLTAGAVPNSMVKSNLAAGQYSFRALYSGDANYKNAVSDCENFSVKLADPSITTTQDPSTAFLGATLTDSAAFSGAYNPGGTIKFTLKNPSNVEVFSNTVPVSGNGTYSTTAAGTITGNNVAAVVGTYHWFASYSGDKNNNPADSINDEPVVINQGDQPTIPTITTTQDPKSAVVGWTLKDKATVTGIVSGTYTITFTLKDPNGAVAHTEGIPNVTTNGTYETPTGHVANIIGTWHWIAVLKDSQGTVVAQTGANDEPVTVAGGEVLAATAMTSPLQALALGLIGIGLVAMMGALAVRRREA